MGEARGRFSGPGALGSGSRRLPVLLYLYPHFRIQRHRVLRRGGSPG
jgi:hypothetical protein